MKKLLVGVRRWLDVFLYVAGTAFISIGAFKIYAPAGYFVIGAGLIATAIFFARARDGGK